MTTAFPGGLDVLTNPTSGQTLNSPSHSSQHTDLNDSLEAIEAKVGIDGSAVATSHDYKLQTRYCILSRGFRAGADLPSAIEIAWTDAAVWDMADFDHASDEFYDADVANTNLDPFGMHDPTTNPSRITVPRTGTYFISGYIQFDDADVADYLEIRGTASAVADFSLGIAVNGSVVVEHNHRQPDPGLDKFQHLTVNEVLRLSATNYVELAVRSIRADDTGVLTMSCSKARLAVVLAPGSAA